MINEIFEIGLGIVADYIIFQENFHEYLSDGHFVGYSVKKHN